jgi:acyl dehydratase
MEVGQTFSRIDGQVTRDGIKAYANAGGDRNNIHLDDEWAAKMGLKGVIAHGMLFFAYMAHLLSDLAGEGKVIRVGGEMRGSVRPGDWVITNATVTKVEGNVVEFDIIQNSKLPLKIERDGQIVKTFEGLEREWVKEGEELKTEETDEGTLTYREALAIKGSGVIELACVKRRIIPFFSCCGTIVSNSGTAEES